MSNVLTHTWNSRLNEAVEVFFVHENSVPGLGPGGPKHVNNESAWYGAAHWFQYLFTPKVTGVYRAEIFRDQNGAATGNGRHVLRDDRRRDLQAEALALDPARGPVRLGPVHQAIQRRDAGSQLTLAVDVIFQF